MRTSRTALAGVLAALFVAAPALAAPSITEHTTTGGPGSIAADAQGRVWFTWDHRPPGSTALTYGIRALNPDGSVFLERSHGGEIVRDISVGPTGLVWYTAGTTLVRVTPDSGQVNSFYTGVHAATVAAGGDGAVWFASGGYLWRRNPDGTQPGWDLTEFGGIRHLTPGPDGRIWFLAASGGIGAVSADGSAVVYRSNIPADLSALAAGPDGGMWFSAARGIVGRISPAGEAHQYDVGHDDGLQGLAAGDDGNLWVADPAHQRILRVTTGGSVTPYTLATGGTVNQVVAAGGGALWYARRADTAGSLGRLVLEAPVAETGTATQVGSDTATLTGTVDPNGAKTSYVFEYGPTSEYGSTTPAAPAGSGDGAQPVSARLSGMLPGTTVHYRLVATSGVGRSVGADRLLTTTVPPPPTGASGDTQVAAKSLLPLTALPKPTFQLYRGRYQLVLDAFVEKLQGGETIVIRCKARGCRRRRIVVPVPSGRRRLSLNRQVRNQRLRFGGRFSIEISRPGHMTQIWSTRIVNRQISRLRITCLNPTTKRSIPC